MTHITIREFTGYTEADFLEYLKIENSICCEVAIPKYSGTDDLICLLSDYICAAYTGELLKAVCQEFLYFEAEHEVPGDFAYLVIGYEPEKLAPVLHTLSQAFAFEPDWDALGEFECEAGIFLGANTDRPYACPYYIHIINQLDEEV